jgi:hypothetical protein
MRTRIGRDEMKYESGAPIHVGNIAAIYNKYRGQVVALVDTSTYLPGYEYCAYLAEGIMVITEFAGLVHYMSQTTDRLVLKTHNLQQ